MEAEKFLGEYFKKNVNHYYEAFWAKNAKGGGLTIKKEDGTELLVDVKNISCDDLGSMCGNCLCGHAIRYEFWFDDYGPIGSSCIQTLTGLDGRDINKIIQGYQYAKKDVDRLKESVRIEGTLSNQCKKFPYIEELIDFVIRNNMVPEIVQLHMDNNVPLAQKEITILAKIKEKFECRTPIIAKYGQRIFDLCQRVNEFESNFGEPMLEYARQLNPKDAFTAITTIADIGKKIMQGYASEKAVTYFSKLCEKISDDRFMEAVNVLFLLKQKDIGDFWTNIINEKCAQAIKYGLSKNEIDFVLTKSLNGKPGLAVRFADKLCEKQNVEVEEKVVEVAQVISEPQNEMDVDTSFLEE